jgi:hypothetical protein
VFGRLVAEPEFSAIDGEPCHYRAVRSLQAEDLCGSKGGFEEFDRSSAVADGKKWCDGTTEIGGSFGI